MRIAICADKDDTNGLVPKYYAEAEFLMIIDADTNVLKAVYPKEDEQNIGFANHMVEEQCEVLICGALPKAPFEIIAGAGITRYDGSTRKVQRAYDYMKRGKLTVIRDHIGGSGVGHTHDFSCECGEGEEFTEEREPIFDAVISAAGLSSRMGDFKPLMMLGQEMILQRQIRTLTQAGVRRIIIVTGHRGDDIKEAVRAFAPHNDIVFAENPAYASTAMLDSVRIGVREAIRDTREDSADGIFIVPVDVPLFTRFTVETLIDWFSMGQEMVYIPEYRNHGGHPILVRTDAVDLLMNGDDTEGLKSILAQSDMNVMRVDVPDRGCSLDADTPEAFEHLQEELQLRRVPSDEDCRYLLAWAGVTEEGVAHARAVAACADDMVDQCRTYIDTHKLSINPGQIHAACLLHDVLKGMRSHEERGGEMLASLGMEEVGRLVASHNQLSDEDAMELNDALIVYLADKLVCGDKLSGLEERFLKKEQLYRNNKAAMAGLNRRRAMAEKAVQLAEKAGWSMPSVQEER